MRQKSKNIFMLSLAAATLLLAEGCDRQAADAPVTGFPEDGVVRVSTGGAVTRADGESQYLGTNLGLFIDYGDDDMHTMENVRWTKETSGWAPDTQMLWKDATTPAALYAYAPYVEYENDYSFIDFEIPSDQTSGTTEADFVFWKNEAFTPNDSNVEFVDGKVLISFSHALTKLTLNFEKASQFASDVTVEKVVLKETAQKVCLNLKNGTVRNSSAWNMIDILMHKVDDLQYEAVFYPADGQHAGNRMLEVTMSDGNVLFYTVPAGGLVEGGLQSGKSYSMNMMLGKDKIEVVLFSVSSWGIDDNFDSSEAEVDGDVWDGSVATSFAAGAGTETSPYIIAKASQLAYLAESVNGGESYSGKYFKQVSDLILADRPWTKIGAYGKPFSGHFNGNGKKISGMNIIGGAYDIGLFGFAENASIVNCHVCGKVDGQGSAGGIVGTLYKSTMANCTAEVTVKGTSSWCGGLCGAMEKSTISDCSVVGCLVEGTADSVGGIVGSITTMPDELEECAVRNCSVSGIVKGYKYVGGLVGDIVNHNVVVSDCTANVDLTVTGSVCGGLVGELSNAKGSFSNCGFDGTVTKAGTDVGNVGAAVGYDSSVVTFSNCWYNADKTGDLPAVGKSVRDAVGKDYSGIEAKNLGK